MRSLICFTIVLIVLPAVAQEQSASESDLASNVAKSIVSRTNDFRKEHDLPAVNTNEHLQKAAEEFAKFMARSAKYGHHADGRTPAQRTTAAGYEYCVVRENIAYRTGPQPTEKKLTDVFVEGWIDSPGHRENMLAEYVTQTGAAVATDDGQTWYAVQLFGRPKSAAFKIRLSNESSATHQIVVETDDGSSDEFEMSPRMMMSMTRCTPVTVSIKGSDVSVPVKESQRLAISDKPDGGVTLEHAAAR